MSEALQPQPNQQKAGETLPDELFQRVRTHQALLDSLKPEQVTDIVKGRITTDLDKYLPYLNELVLFRGSGWVPEFDDDGDYIEDRYRHVEQHEGISLGFYVMPQSEGGSPYKIAHGFELLRMTLANERVTIINTTVNRCYMDPESLSVLSLEELAEPFANQGEITDESQAYLTKRSEVLAATLQTPVFQSMRAKSQQRYFDMFIDDVEEKVPLRGKYLTFEADYCYTVRTDGGVMIGFAKFNDAHEGLCLGVGCAEQLLLPTNEPISSSDQIMDKEAGLCIIVEPSQTSREIIGLPEGLLYIPISSQDMEVAFE